MNMKNNKSGITLIELLIVLSVFSVVMAGLYSAYRTLMVQGVKEFRKTASSVELDIAGGILERDLMMAGYGLAEDYSLVTAVVPPYPVAAQATEGGAIPDTLTLRGTAIGMGSRAAQGWTYVYKAAVGVNPTFQTWNDQREDVNKDDGVLIMEPSTKKILALPASDCFFTFNGNNNNVTSTSTSQPYPFNNVFQEGTVLYGFYSTTTPPIATQLQYDVVYSTSAPGPANVLSTCEPGTRTLRRSETKGGGATVSPLFNCVLDFQVALGLDTDENGSIDLWDNGGVVAQTWGGITSSKVLNRRLKQIRVYILVQDGMRDPTYTYSNPDPAYAATPNTIRVGDLTLTGGAVGRDVVLTPAQRQYRWKMISFAVTPRNIR
jgi:prepilin-type N-terminal cleavage/methylation domain-containing protein